MALDGGTVWETRTTGSQNRGGGFVWINILDKSTVEWYPSGSGTDEYYLQALGGGDPGISACNDLYLDGRHNKATQGSVGSLAVEEWDYGDNDALGYSVPYARLLDGADPDTKSYGYIGYGKGGGVDYTQQDAAQLSLTDLTTDALGTTLSSVTGGFTALMVGNIVYIRSGTGFTPGWYEITAFTDTNNVTIDRSAGALASAGAGEVGGGRSLPLDPHYEIFVDGNENYIKSGTYVPATINVGNDASVNVTMKIKGYKTTRGDFPLGDDRPLITTGANLFTFDNYWNFFNIRVNSTSSETMGSDNGFMAYNCKAVNSSTITNRGAIVANNGFATIIYCEGISTNGYALRMGNTGKVNLCYAHDSSVGIYAQTSAIPMAFNVVSSCVTGVSIGAAANDLIINNTIYDCTTGISSNGIYHNIFNNLIDTCTTGVSIGTQTDSILLDFNNFNNNTTDVVNCRKGLRVTLTDPTFTDVTLIAGTDGETLGGVLTSTTPKDLSTVVADQDYCWIKSGSVVTANEFHLITAVNDGADQLTLSPDPGDSGTDDIVWSVVTGHDFSVGTNVKGTALPGTVQGGLSTGYLDQGAVQREEAGNGETSYGCVL